MVARSLQPFYHLVPHPPLEVLAVTLHRQGGYHRGVEYCKVEAVEILFSKIANLWLCGRVNYYRIEDSILIARNKTVSIRYMYSSVRSKHPQKLRMIFMNN